VPVLAIVADVDPNVTLLPHDIGYGATQLSVES
jgi:hypothetical protein